MLNSTAYYRALDVSTTVPAIVVMSLILLLCIS